MNLEGRYIKVLNDSSKQHYPCLKGDYILFNKMIGDLEFWGIPENRSNYWGLDTHKNPDFELMPEGFSPNNYEIY